jgi:SAM-dependent methyltransferase
MGGLSAWVFALLWRGLGMDIRTHKALRETKVALMRDAALSGRVLDVGTGTGIGLSHLCRSESVREVVCVEPNAYFRAALRAAIELELGAARARGQPLTITHFEGTLAEYLRGVGPAGEGAFDAIACLLVLCSVPEQDAALHACARLLRTGGKLVYLEHVRAESRTLRALQKLLQPAWGLVGDGCHLCRDTAASLDRVGAATGKWRTRGFHRQVKLGAFVPFICGVCSS